MCEERVTCQTCDGTGRETALLCSRYGPDGRSTSRFENRPCRRCGGKKTITRAQADMIVMGRRHRLNRIAAMESARTCAERLGVDVPTLCKAEAGYVVLVGVSVAPEEVPGA